MSQEALDIFDVCNTVFISTALLITLPLALFVYAKLLFTLPYSRNFTFKLIVFNGMTELLSCMSFLCVYQISSFAFSRPLIAFLHGTAAGATFRTLDYLFNGLALHSAFFVALNRLKTMVYMKWKGTDASFVLVSIVMSLILSSHRIIDLFCFTDQYYEEVDLGSGAIFIPRIYVHDGKCVWIQLLSHETLRTITDVEIAVACGATLAVNILLAILLTRRRKAAESHGKMKAEKGLIITSVVSFLFYTIYYVNNCIARYTNINFFGYTQFLFLGLASLTPFWEVELRIAFYGSTQSEVRNNGSPV